MDFNRLFNGMIRAMRFDKEFYEEVEHDTSYNQDALAVVILVAGISALGAFLTNLIVGNGFLYAIVGLVVAGVLAVAGYYLWVYVLQYVGTRYFKGQADIGEVQRALGFAYSPQVFLLFGFIPCIGWIIAALAWVWSLATGFVAVRQSLDQDDQNAILTAVISGVVVVIALALVRWVVRLIFPGLAM